MVSWLCSTPLRLHLRLARLGPTITVMVTQHHSMSPKYRLIEAGRMVILWMLANTAAQKS